MKKYRFLGVPMSLIVMISSISLFGCGTTKVYFSSMYVEYQNLLEKCLDTYGDIKFFEKSDISPLGMAGVVLRMTIDTEGIEPKEMLIVHQSENKNSSEMNAAPSMYVVDIFGVVNGQLIQIASEKTRASLSIKRCSGCTYICTSEDNNTWTYHKIDSNKDYTEVSEDEYYSSNPVESSSYNFCDEKEYSLLTSINEKTDETIGKAAEDEVNDYMINSDS